MKNIDKKIFEKFPIGTKVLVRKTLKRKFSGSADDHINWVSEDCEPFHAMICGCKWKCDGDHFFPGKYSTFRLKSKNPCFIVKRFMFGKETLVPLDGVELADFNFFVFSV